MSGYFNTLCRKAKQFSMDSKAAQIQQRRTRLISLFQTCHHGNNCPRNQPIETYSKSPQELPFSSAISKSQERLRRARKQAPLSSIKPSANAVPISHLNRCFNYIQIIFIIMFIISCFFKIGKLSNWWFLFCLHHTFLLEAR